MVSETILRAKLGELTLYVERIRKHARQSAAELVANRDALDLVSFNLMLAVQACADIASHLASDEGWAPAVTLAAGFQRMHEANVISESTARALVNAARFRNVVAHGYAAVNAESVFRASTEGLSDLEAFQHEVALWLQARIAP